MFYGNNWIKFNWVEVKLNCREILYNMGRKSDLCVRTKYFYQYIVGYMKKT